MRNDTALTPTLLADYVPLNFNIEKVFLDFELGAKATVIRSKLVVSRTAAGALVLDGEAIELRSVSVDDKVIARSEYKLTQTTLELPNLPQNCEIEIETVCDPSANSTLMGLYVSGGRFCTQCEAQGFRRMTFYPDRPDVLSVFTVQIRADKKAYPYLLANGNCVETGDLKGGMHFAVWEDPFPKPCYLFALVAGDFDILEDSFTTMSARKIPLTIYVDKGDAPRAEYAMDALKRSMKWDEDAFGREYDLDRFMIVAVRDFNFGAMENKGLNIFNSSLLLADGASATDMNFERIESVVAHEYFHNWTGNRITCRDWFQLCLKEGFTVFRDQEFSADERGAAVQRIKDVRALRGRQFPEDAGPLAHPVRPDSYVKIDNFYTATIYEKGAELIRMLRTILGRETFRKGCDYYFETLDGTAATVEQFITCFEHSSGEDLSSFMHWYEQAGTPHLTVERDSAQGAANHVVTFSQHSNPTPGQAKKTPLPLPIRWQIIGDNGPLSEQKLTVLRGAETSVSYPAIDAPHSLSVLQDFSAPVILKSRANAQDHLRLMGQDPNAFTRWEAGQTLARGLLQTLSQAIETGKAPAADRALSGYLGALKTTLEDDSFEDSFKALTLAPPSDMDILQSRSQSDPLAVMAAGGWLRRAVADHLGEALIAAYHAMKDSGPFSSDAASAGRRALKNSALALLGAGQNVQAAPLALAQFKTATNMTDELSALSVLTRLGGVHAEQSLSAFYDKWKDSPLVLDKWFALQARRDIPNGVSGIKALTKHASYDRRNPNRVRALLGNFAMGNPSLFHHHSGSGYAFFAGEVLDMDSRNPQVAARLAGAFDIWPKLDSRRQALIKTQLGVILAAEPSKNLAEICGKIRGASKKKP